MRSGEVWLTLDESSDDTPFEADPELLARALGNMVQNALEATPAGGVVKVWHTVGAGGPTFFVNNPGVMRERVASQVFKRSFSTKGNGRGLGTYGMKLLGERYLGGRVGFRSEDGVGTTFWLALGAEGSAR